MHAVITPSTATRSSPNVARARRRELGLSRNEPRNNARGATSCTAAQISHRNVSSHCAGRPGIARVGDAQPASPPTGAIPRLRARQRRYHERHRTRLNETRRGRDRARYAANRESLLSARREQYRSDQALAERIRARNRAWYERKRDQRREYRRRYWQEHGDELHARSRERNRRRYAEDPRVQLDYYKQWRLQNLERARAYVRVSAHKRRANAAGTHFTFEAWEELLRTHGGRCAYCGSTDHIEADHRIPLCRGGTNEINNILPACRRCNRRKHRKTEDEFRAVLAAEGSNSRA